MAENESARPTPRRTTNGQCGAGRHRTQGDRQGLGQGCDGSVTQSTRLLAEHIREPQAEQVATTIYGVNLLLASVLVSVLWRYSVRAHLVHPDAEDLEIQVLTRRLTPGLAGYVVLICVGIVLPIVSVVGYLVIAIFFIFPFRHLRPHPE